MNFCELNKLIKTFSGIFVNICAGAGNSEFEFSNGILDQTQFCAKDFHRLPQNFQKPKNSMNTKSSPKRANEYSLERSLNLDYEYPPKSFQFFLGSMDRAC